MTTKLVRYQLIAFAIIAVLGIVFVGAKYVRLDNLVGIGQYTVTAELPVTGGLYSDAEVTYRGVPVGRVGDLDLTANGVSAELLIDTGAPDIPESAKAVVANRSAIGEQYVDLQPSSDEGPYLREGSVITSTTTPTPVEELISSVDTLARNVPLEALSRVVTELGTAFDGQGDNLQTLVDSLVLFTETGIEALPETLKLIRDGRMVLDTQAEQSPAIRSFAAGLDSVADQLRSSDPDIRRLIGTGTDAADQTDALLRTSGPGLTEDLTNLNATMQALAPKAFNLKPLLQLLPALSIGGSATAPGDGTTHFGLVLETNNPPACTVGYEGTQEILQQMKLQNPNFDDSRDDFPFNTDAKCRVPQGNPTSVRGSGSAVYTDPAVPQPWDDNPKVDPDKLNLAPVATQLATLMGITPKR